METHYTLQAGQIFTIFFIMLGPLRLVSPYSAVSMSLAQEDRQMFAIKTASIAALILILAGFLGSQLLEKWHIDPATLLLAAGFLFFLSAIRPLISSEEKTKEVITDKSPASIALNLVVSPYGLATVIVLFSISQDPKRDFTIISCLLGVMILDLIYMAFSKPKVDGKKSVFSQSLSVIFATMQFALSLQIIIMSLRTIGIIEK
jgi:multiple antibiotic resistance protein